ncbi:MAG: class I SAM-dependent methyltransferase [Chitinophagaceae bacterium]|nr:class I SAM-dependent methyltransferase [Chitinophagaceae bacterium]
MYSLVKIASKYIRYFLFASNGKGHGVHSPFVFDFIKNVLNDKRQFYAYESVEGVRKQMITNDTVVTITDYGAGSTVSKSNERKVNSIARASLKPAKYGQLLFRIANYYKSKTIVELGTSLGVTTAYLASANPSGKVLTFEGADEVSNIASQNFEHLGLNNIEVIEGNFDNTLIGALQKLSSVDLAFVDGNHRKEPTLNYFYQLLEKANESSIFIFDDIHWSKTMEEAWDEIRHHASVTLSIDLFFIGLVFFRPEQKKQQHFTVRF